MNTTSHMPAPHAPWAVRMQGIVKRFGAVQANAGVDLSVQRGTVHALVGENGAGKSTLMSVLYGFYQAEAGHIEIDGQPVEIAHSQQAIALGLGMVHQHFMLVDTLSALDNVLLGSETDLRLRRAEQTARARLQTLMDQCGLHVALDSLVADLSVGDRQRLEILKALYRGARILILDEPTAVLTPQETRQLFEVLDRLRAQGTTIILITHKLKEVMSLCDAVTVMRAGRVVHECAIADTSVEQLAEAMVGRKVNLGRGDARARLPHELPVRRLRLLRQHELFLRQQRLPGHQSRHQSPARSPESKPAGWRPCPRSPSYAARPRSPFIGYSNPAGIPGLRTLHGATLGIIGFGEVGRDVAGQIAGGDAHVVLRREVLGHYELFPRGVAVPDDLLGVGEEDVGPAVAVDIRDGEAVADGDFRVDGLRAHAERGQVGGGGAHRRVELSDVGRGGLLFGGKDDRQSQQRGGEEWEGSHGRERTLPRRWRQGPRQLLL